MLNLLQVDQETLEPKKKLAEDAIEWCKSIGELGRTSTPDFRVNIAPRLT